VTGNLPAASEVLVMSALMVTACPTSASAGLIVRLADFKLGGDKFGLPEIAKVENCVRTAL